MKSAINTEKNMFCLFLFVWTLGTRQAVATSRHNKKWVQDVWMVGELSYPGRDLVSVSVVVDMGLSEKKGEASKSHAMV